MSKTAATTMNKKRKTMETDYDMVNEDTKDFDWKNGYIAIKQKLIESEDRANKMERLVEELKTKLAKACNDEEEQLSDDEESVDGNNNDPWMANFKELRAYRMLHGDCNVGRKGPNPSLGRWVKNQRFLYGNTKLGRNGAKLSQDRIDKLESIGFNFGREFPQPKPWDDYYEELVKHKKVMGHCNVHINMKTSPSPLAKWASTQRVEYKRMHYGKDTLLNMEQVAKLKEIGFKFNGPKLVG